MKNPSWKQNRETISETQDIAMLRKLFLTSCAFVFMLCLSRTEAARESRVEMNVQLVGAALFAIISGDTDLGSAARF